MNLLLLSSSRADNSDYLAPYISWIRQQMKGMSELLYSLRRGQYQLR
jgi:dipeptidase E